MAIYLTTSGRGRLQHIIFALNHHFSPDFLGTCVHYYYICNVNILTPVHAPPDCHNAVGAHDHSEPPCFRHCRKQREDHATQPYKYIGKELDLTHGHDWYDHGARHYDPATGRWNTMDKICDEYYGISPYYADIDIKIFNRNLFNCKINLALWAKHHRNTFLQGR